VLIAVVSALTLAFEDVHGPTVSTAWSQSAAGPVRSSDPTPHFSEVIRLHDAVVRGDLAGIRTLAQQIARSDRPPELPAGADAYLTGISREAARAAEAADVVAAASATASMLAICGSCHQASHATPVLKREERPPTSGVAAHMHQHLRSVDLMLQGLMVPSTDLWRQGAEGFRSEPLQPGELPQEAVLTRDILAAEARVHRLASQAVMAYDTAAQASFYAQILAQCAECPRLNRERWGPKAR